MKKFFVMLLIVWSMILPKVFAANDIDWNSVPRFNNQSDLANYLNRCKNNLDTYVPVVLTDGFISEFNNLLLVKAFFWLKSTNYGSDGQNTEMLYEITNYPGERVAYAYLNGDTSFLNDEEIQLYNEAVKIVDAAKNNSPTPLRMELYIHDEITSRTTYYNEEPQPNFARFKTATGALIDGKANCQGYADAFYMLGTMCGLNVDKVNGYGNDVEHIWNTITFGDQSYFVDVTFDDASFNINGETYNGYIYFNSPTDVIQADRRWFPDCVPLNLQQYPDGRYFFYTREYETTNGRYFGTHANSAEEAIQHIAYNIARRGWKFSYVVAPYNANYTDVNYPLNYLVKDLLPQYGWNGTVNMNVMWRGNYMFFTVDATVKK